MKAWVNGKFIPAEEANVPILCHSFSRGSAVFDVLEFWETTRGRAMFRATEHVERFFNSAKLLHMPLPMSREELIDIMKAVIVANSISSGAVKFFAYYCLPEIGLIPKAQPVSLAVFCVDLAGIFGDSYGQLTKPVTAGISSVRKLSPNSVAIHAKACGYYVNPFLAESEMLRKGYDTAIMLDEAGFVAEGALTNIFFVKNGIVSTPKLRNALPGITRDSVIEIANRSGLPLEEADISPEQACQADEAFCTGSVLRVRPIRSIDGKAIGRDCPGPITRQIRTVLNDAYAGRDSQYEAWLTPVE